MCAKLPEEDHADAEGADASAWYDYVNVTIRDTIVMNAHGGLLVSVRGPGSIRGLTVTNLLVLPPRHQYPDRNPDLTEISLHVFENWYAEL